MEIMQRVMGQRCIFSYRSLNRINLRVFYSTRIGTLLAYILRKRIFCIDLPIEWYVYTFLCIYFYLYVCVCIVLYNVCVGASQCYPSAPSGSDKICYAGSSQLSNSPLQIAGATSLGYFFQKRKYLQYYHIKQNIRKHL